MKRLTILTVLLLPLLVGCETILEQIRNNSWQTGEETPLDRDENKPFLSQKQVRQIAKAITVKVNNGSGVIIAKEGNNYLILTNSRTVATAKSLTITTEDEVNYPAKLVETVDFLNKDLAILEFSSENKYQVAVIDRTTFLKQDIQVLAAGYSADEGLKYSSGKINLVTDKPLKEGYQIGYNSTILMGMSGGPILNASTGKLIGINGVVDYQKINQTLAFSDGTIPNNDLVKSIIRSKWGIAIETALAALKPEFLTRYSLPQSKFTARELTGKAAELDKIARGITVRIDRGNNKNGSGVIIGKQNNIYYVLTANDIIDNISDNDDRYFIITPNGNRYKIEKANLTTQPGVNLAVIKFTSNEIYRIARIGDYQKSTIDSQNIFISGWIEPQKTQLRNWYFSSGTSLENYLDVNDRINFVAGYNLEYSNISYSGMHGGPVLDSNGRLIGIHGKISEKIAISDNKSAKIELPIGNSSGISIQTFLSTLESLQIDKSLLKIEAISPQKLNQEQIASIERSREIVTVPPNSSNATLWLKKGNNLWRAGKITAAIAAYDRAIELKPSFLAEIHYAKGILLQQNSQNKEADRHYIKAIEIKPDFAAAWYRKSQVEYNLERGSQALAAIEKAIQLEPKKYKYYIAKGKILHSLGDYSASIKTYNQAITIRPNYYLYSLRGMVSFDAGEYQTAIKDFNTALAQKPNDGENLILRGNTYVELKEYDKGIADLTAAIDRQQNPEIALFAYNGRGLAKIKQGNIAAAKEDYKKAIEQSNLAIERQPQNPKLYLIRGVTHTQLENPNAAIADFTKAIEIDPQNAKAYKFRADLQFDLEQFDAAIKDYNSAIAIWPNNANLYYNRAKVYLQQQEYQKAIEDYTKILSIDPTYPDAYKNRANTRLQTNDRNGAIEDYTSALKYDKDNPTIYFLRGLTYFHLEAKDKAIADYDRAITIKPDYVEAYNSRGIARFQLGQYNQAIADFNQAIAIDPDYADAYTSRASAKYQSGDPNGAIADYTKALENKPSGIAFVYSLRGNLYSELNEPDKAIADYTKAIDNKPDLVQAYQQRAELFIDAKKYQKALKDLNKVIEYRSNNPQAYFSRAAVYSKLGQYELARQDSNTALKYQSNLHLAYYIRGVTYLQLEEYQKATADARELIDRQPNISEGYLLQGAVYYKKQEYSKALEFYQKALDKNKNNWSAFTNIGLTKYETHLTDDAIAAWQKAIEIQPKEAQPLLALAVAQYTHSYSDSDKEKALAMARVALKLDKRLADRQYLRQHTLWGDKLLTDTTNLLSNAKIIQFLSSN